MKLETAVLYLLPTIFGIFFADAFNKVAYQPKIVATSRTKWLLVLVCLEKV
jgi:hypothetical protein